VKAQQPAPAARSTSHGDEVIKREVGHELALLPWYSVFDNLSYSVSGYKVTLMGQVVRPSLKDDAEAAAKHVEGVESVDDQIEVLPLSPNDDQIRRAEFRAIYSKPTLQRYAEGNVQQIHIIVKNGNVTLEGAVASQADKDAANIYANTVPGVFSVTNNLQVTAGK
jgi:hyperosmotically inducible protein